jgi:hypothetical protein
MMGANGQGLVTSAAWAWILGTALDDAYLFGLGNAGLTVRH